MKILNYVLMSLLIIGLAACTSTNTTTVQQTEKAKQTTETTQPKPVATTNAAPKPQKKGYNIGDKVADFSLKNIDSKMVSLSDYEDDKGVILIFTCNHCPYAVMYEDRINDLHNTFASKGYPVLAINPNDPEVKPEDSMPNMKKRAAEKGFKFPYLFDDGQKLYPLFGATRTPEVYLLKNDGGKMVVAYSGAIDNNHKDASAVTIKYVEDAIEAVVNGKNPDPNFTKAVGCTIKTKKS